MIGLLLRNHALVRLVDTTDGMLTVADLMHNVQFVDIIDGRATVAEPYIMYSL